MSWKKYFKPVNSVLPSSASSKNSSSYTNFSRFSTWLPDVYQGPPDRLQRYGVYETMDMDHEVHAALDTISDFSTEESAQTKISFEIFYHNKMSPSEIEILNNTLRQWNVLNDFNKRLWSMFRNVLKYGDQFFIRDPKSYKLFWCDPNKVIKVVVNESDGKKIEMYCIKDIDLNLQCLVATDQTLSSSNTYGTSNLAFSPPMNGNIAQSAGYSISAKSGSGYANNSETPIDANYVVHLSLSDGMNSAWPFGVSVLECIYKVFKQKELLEDAILIYRVHRAPERRVFFIDVGTMPPNKATQYLERVRYEVQQKRIPSRSGGSNSNVADSTYNPQCLALDTKIPLLDGRTLSLSELIEEYNSGKENWVYSCNPETGETVPGIISWAGVTRKDSDVVTLVFDNEKSITCTLDHKFPVKGVGFVEAKDLTSEHEIFGKNEKTLKVLNFVYTDKRIDTGCITIDQEEKYHNYHTFLTDSAVFTKNSMLEDYFFSVTCLALDTEVPLLDGRTLELQDLIKEFEEGKENYTYTVNQETSEVITGKIVWGGVTRKDAELVEILLSNSNKIKCTPDHRFIMRDGSEVEAQHLKHNDSVMSLKEETYRVESVTWLDYREDTGDITIESEGNWHNFATAAGVYVHNSEGRGSKVEVLPGGDNLGCFTLDTKVKLIDGRDLTLLEVRQEMEEGKTLFTYSCHPETGEIAPGLISGSGVTQKDAKIIRLNLSNGKTIKCTPEHKFPIKDVGFVEAQNLNIGTQLNTQFNELVFLESVEDLGETSDVGTLMIDYHETYHNWHTYLLSDGVFVKNSIDDLRYFNNKMLRALGVPSSYLPSGPDDGTAGFNDGRVGAAFIQEFRFSKVCERYQKQIVKPLDREFKLYLKHCGVTLDNSLFELKLTTPQSFSEYRQMELDAAHINTFGALADVPYISKRFALKRYLGWTEEEIHENEALWKEEKLKNKASNKSSGASDAKLSDIGITSSGIDSMAPEGGFEEQGELDLDGAEDSTSGNDEFSDSDIDSFGEDDEVK